MKVQVPVLGKPRASGFFAPALVGLGLLLAGSAVSAVQAAPSPGVAALDAPVRLTILPGSSEARYHLTLHMLMGGLNSEGLCATRDVSGDLVFAPDGTVMSDVSKIVIDQRTLRCNPPVRDATAQALLETETYPTADFVVREAPGFPFPPASGTQAAFQLLGDQTVHGVTRPSGLDVNATFTDAGADGTVLTKIKMTDYGMSPPKRPPLYNVDDNLIVEVELHAAYAPMP